MKTRRVLLIATLSLVISGLGGTACAQANAKPETRTEPAASTLLSWHDVTTWGVEGRAWPDQKRLRYFDRLPASAEEPAKLILDFYKKASAWDVSRCSAGMMVRFRTDATAIHVRYRLFVEELALPHMPATGVSGVDLYARDERGHWRYVQGNKPKARDVTSEIVTGMSPGMREFAIYLPLYNGVDSFDIGVPEGAAFVGLPPREKPIVFYGTSITQGGVASRPGMVHTAILGRRLDRPVLNLGFSGNGHMDESIGNYMVQVDAALYVIECSGNMQPAQIRERCAPLVRQLRAARPQTPIVLVEDRAFPSAWIMPDKAKYNRENHAALRESFDALRAAGVSGIYYIAGDDLFGTDGEGTTDNAHASDLGFMRMADAMEPVLRTALESR